MSNKFSRALRRLYATCFNNWAQNCIYLDKTAFYGDDGLFANMSAPWFDHYGLVFSGIKRSSCRHIKPVKKQDFSDSIMKELESRTLNDLNYMPLVRYIQFTPKWWCYRFSSSATGLNCTIIWTEFAPLTGQPGWALSFLLSNWNLSKPRAGELM